MSPNTFENAWFLCALIGAAAFAAAWRFVVTPRRAVVSTPPLTVPQIACLRSWRAPLVAAMAQLRADGHLDADGRLDPAKPLPPGTDAFTRHMLRRLDRSVFSVDQLLYDELAPLGALEDELARRGYLHTSAEKWRIRFGAAPLTALCVAGVLAAPIVLAARGVPADRAIVGFTVPAVVAAVVVLPWLWHAPRTTAAGQRAFAEQRERAAYLAPRTRPAFTTYGAGAVGLSVALFGTAALWQFDPRYAAAMAVAGGSGDGGAGGSCGSAFTCGGDSGGCGSSCGSSCGGGGGGGGCGG
ncbi:TIGR04222 domain-containing membrane protein [Tsukamurella sp. PLM1]|uniref:TIGR04222 domain-containing membrane protein n=1 Tax=Tsukamurella sp. PLM1 TaxID=2929795 RepID=UPI0020686DD2|nr:TIGR04222 domain-containing membrane protein [Tsukamurella sp. PLM1]BDH57486.1 hypothetical protein MTP03_24250 [Tsukamurella sp. PLM1]